LCSDGLTGVPAATLTAGKTTATSAFFWTRFTDPILCSGISRLLNSQLSTLNFPQVITVAGKSVVKDAGITIEK
jgi:hypothetical protein